MTTNPELSTNRTIKIARVGCRSVENWRGIGFHRCEVNVCDSAFDYRSNPMLPTRAPTLSGA